MENLDETREERKERLANEKAERLAERLRKKAEREAMEAIEAEERLARREAAMTKTTKDINDILFDVEIIDNPNLTNSEYSKIVVGQTPEGEMDLNYCSPRYELIPNSDIFPNVEEVLNSNGIEFDVTYQHINHVRFYADYEITDKRYTYTMNNTTDDIVPMLRVQHSYNGLTKYRIVFGYFRMVCTNGLVIPVQEMNEFNLVIVGKHTDSIKKSFAKLDTLLRNFVDGAKEITTEITRKYEILGGHWVANVQDRLTEVLEASKVIIVDTSKFNTLNDITNRINEEANNDDLGYDGKVNDWLIYNGINQYLNDNDRNIAAPEKRMETDSKVFEYMLETA